MKSNLEHNIKFYLDKRLLAVDESIRSLRDERNDLLMMLKAMKQDAMFESPVAEVSKIEEPVASNVRSKDEKLRIVNAVIALVDAEGMTVDAASKRCGLNNFGLFYNWKREFGIDWSPKSRKKAMLPEQTVSLPSHDVTFSDKVELGGVYNTMVADKKRPGRQGRTEQEKRDIVMAIIKTTQEEKCSIEHASRKHGLKGSATYYFWKSELGIEYDARVGRHVGEGTVYNEVKEAAEGKPASDEVVEVDLTAKRKMWSEDDDLSAVGRRRNGDGAWNERERGVKYFEY